MFTILRAVTAVCFFDISFFLGLPYEAVPKHTLLNKFVCFFRKIEDLQFSIEEASIDKNDFKVSVVNFFIH